MSYIWKSSWRKSAHPYHYFNVKVYSIYGELISDLEIKLNWIVNPGQYTSTISSLLGLSLSSHKYDPSKYFKPKPVPSTEKGHYSFLYEEEPKTFYSASYFVGKTYRGLKVGSHLNTITRDAGRAKFFTYVYSNCYIDMRNGYYPDPHGHWRFQGNIFKVFKYIPPADTRIPTTCCLLWRCYPDKYKKA